LAAEEQAAWVDYGVGEYLHAARRYRDQLRLIEPDEASDSPREKP
jgi:hypothetical protein